MLRPGLRHLGHREQRRRVRNVRSYSGADAGAFLRADARARRPDRFSSLRADAAAFLTPGAAAHASTVADADPPADARTNAAPYAWTDAPAEPAPDAGAVAKARRPHGRAGPRAFSEAHAGAVATANAAAVARADAGARRPYSCARLRADA